LLPEPEANIPNCKGLGRSAMLLVGAGEQRLASDSAGSIDTSVSEKLGDK
jgi:hypothetical protein